MSFLYILVRNTECFITCNCHAISVEKGHLWGKAHIMSSCLILFEQKIFFSNQINNMFSIDILNTNISTKINFFNTHIFSKLFKKEQRKWCQMSFCVL